MPRYKTPLQQKAKAKLRLFIEYVGDEATTNNISYILKRAVEHLSNSGMLTDGFDTEVAEYGWDWECDIFLEDK